MIDFKNSENMVMTYKEYQKLIAIGEKNILDSKLKMNEELRITRQKYNEKIEALTNKKRNAVTEIENKHKSFQSETHEKNANKQLYVKFINNMVNVLNGRKLNKVYRIVEGDIYCAVSNKIVFFDKLYDSEFMSLRGIILKRKNGYGLIIAGFSENDTYIQKKSRFSLFLKHGMKDFTVYNEIYKDSDLESIVEYYNNNIKGVIGHFEVDNEVNQLIEKEQELNNGHKLILEHEKLMSFKDLFSHVCEDCDFGIIDGGNKNIICDKCGNTMKIII